MRLTGQPRRQRVYRATWVTTIITLARLPATRVLLEPTTIRLGAKRLQAVSRVPRVTIAQQRARRKRYAPPAVIVLLQRRKLHAMFLRIALKVQRRSRVQRDIIVADQPECRFVNWGHIVRLTRRKKMIVQLVTIAPTQPPNCRVSRQVIAQPDRRSLKIALLEAFAHHPNRRRSAHQAPIAR